MDFERRKLSEQLAVAGFDSTRPTFFSWLGVSQYLTLSAIDEMLGFVAGLPSPSTVVLTFVLSDEALTDDEQSRKRQFIRMAADCGEAWLTFFRPDDRDAPKVRESQDLLAGFAHTPGPAVICSVSPERLRVSQH